LVGRYSRPARTEGHHGYTDRPAVVRSGRRKTPRIIYAHFQNVSGSDIGQLKDMARQIVVWPPELKTGNLVYPYGQASR
jgi:hypothetical protein